MKWKILEMLCVDDRVNFTFMGPNKYFNFLPVFYCFAVILGDGNVYHNQYAIQVSIYLTLLQATSTTKFL